MPLNKQKLQRRLITGVSGILVVFLFVVILPSWCLHLLLVGLAVVGTFEFGYIAKGHGFHIYRPIVVGVVALGIATLYTDAIQLVWLPYIALLACGLISLLPPNDMRKALPQVGLTLTAAAYLGFALVSIAYLFVVKTDNGSVPTGRALVSFCLLMVWAGDTAAYFVGSILGKHRIAPQASPKKTYEGTFGNLLGNYGMAWIGKLAVFPQMSQLDLVVLALIFGALGFYGDIIESTWKRGAGVKDSGRMLPGHGGLLDRLDSIFLTAPLLYLYMTRIVL